MHAYDALGPLGRFGDLGHRERRCVRRQHGVGASDAIELGERLPLELELFEDRLDDEVAVGEVGEVGRQRQTRESGVPLGLPQPPFLHSPREVTLDGRAAPLAELVADLTSDGLEA